MKKYITGIIAVIIAIGAVAFSNPGNKVKPLATKIFQYQPPATDPYDQPNVEDRSNWVITNLSSTTCSQADEKACQLLVNTSDINPDNTLKSSFVIDSQMFATKVFYVSGGSAADIYNRNN